MNIGTEAGMIVTATVGPVYYAPIMFLAPCQALYIHCIESSQPSWDYEVGISQIRELRCREAVDVRFMIQCLCSTHYIGRWGR